MLFINIQFNNDSLFIKTTTNTGITNSNLINKL